MAAPNFIGLGFQVDTDGAERAKAALDGITASGVRAGQSVDIAAQRMTGMSIGARSAANETERLAVATNKGSADLLAMGRAAAGSKASLEDMARALEKQATAVTGIRSTAKHYFETLSQLKQAHEAEAAAAANLANSSEAAAGKMAFLGGAIGSVAGIIAFQFIGALGSAISELARLPMESARAADSLTMLEAKLKFAFRGSAEAARQAREEIIQIARTSGLPYNQVADQYADLAISGRSAGLTRSQVGGLTEAFSNLGLMTGADQGRIGRAQWQLQQALALGRLQYSDYRLMASNLPAIDDALGAGLGVDPNRIPGMISRGEISSDRLVEGLTRGVEILAQSADGLPRTMERARGRIQTEWEIMLADMGRAIRSSEWFQAMMGGVAGQIQGFGQHFRPNEQWVSEGVSLGRIRPFGTANGDSNLQNEINRAADGIATARGSRGTVAAEAAREAAEVRNRSWTRGLQILSERDPYASARGEFSAQAAALRAALANSTGRPAEEATAMRRELSIIEGQIARIGPAWQQMTREMRQSQRDFEEFGPGPAFDMATRARGLVEQSIGQGSPISMAQALRLDFDRMILQARNDNGVRTFDVERREQLLRPAFGGDAATRRRAELDYGDATFRARFGATNQAEVAGLVAADRGLRERDLALSDAQALAERARADEERVASMRLQLSLGIQLGQAGRIALAQAERELELRRQFPAITQAQIDAEKARVAESIRVSEQLDIQQRQYGLLVDAAGIAGTSISSAFRESIIDGVRSGTLRAETFLDALGDSALRVADRITAAMMLPFENQATDFFSSFLSNIPGLGSIFGAKKSAFGNVISYGHGGVVSSPQLFAFGGGIGLRGEAGPEAILPLQRGSDGRLGVASHGGSGAPSSQPLVQIIDMRSGGAPAETEETRGPNGERIFRVMIKDAVKQEMGKGGFDQEMRARYGATQAVRRV